MKTIAFLFALVASTCALAQETLRTNLQPGLTVAFDQQNQMQLNMSMQVGAQPMNVQQNITQTMKGTMQVLEAQNGRATKARFSFEPNIGTTMNMMGQQQVVPMPIAGRSLEATLNASGMLSTTAVDQAGMLPMLDQDTQQALIAMMSPQADLLPNRVVNVGEEWTTTVGSPQDTLRPTLTFRVEGYEMRQGRKVARLSVRGNLSGVEGGMNMSAEMTGTSILDVATGLDVQSTMTGPMRTSGTVTENGMQIQMQGTGTITQNSKSTIGGAAPATTLPRLGFPPQGQQPEQNDPSALLPGWKRHTDRNSGYSFQVPQAWNVQTDQQGIIIVPNDQQQDREMIVAFGAPSGGITDAASPMLQQNLDTMIRQQAPMLSRQGPPTKVNVPSGSAATYTYSGMAPDGQQIVAKVTVRTSGPMMLAVTLMGQSDRVAFRSPTIEKIVRSILTPAETSQLNQGQPNQGQPNRGQPGAQRTGQPGGQPAAQLGDPRLVGMFKGESIASGSGVYVNTQIVYAFSGDGFVYNGAQSHFNTSRRDVNGNLIYTADGSSDGSMTRGRWQAAGGMLTIQWDSGQRAVFAYGFEPDGSLVLRNPQTRELINFFPRVQ